VVGEVMTCLFGKEVGGRNCHGPVELHEYRPTRRPDKHGRVWLCAFHGKVWPKVGEAPADTEKRTAAARRRLANRHGRRNPFKGSI
jgi:hypothetical protein